MQYINWCGVFYKCSDDYETFFFTGTVRDVNPDAQTFSLDVGLKQMQCWYAQIQKDQKDIDPKNGEKVEIQVNKKPNLTEFEQERFSVTKIEKIK
jgi:hypothetical protein